MSERPGGFAPNHRRVRRQEEIIWLRVQGFTRVVSLLPSSHNLAAYDEGEHGERRTSPSGPAGTQREILLRTSTGTSTSGCAPGSGCSCTRRSSVTGSWAWWPVTCCGRGRLPGGPQAIAVVERLVGHQMGPPGRDIVAQAVTLDAAP